MTKTDKHSGAESCCEHGSEWESLSHTDKKNTNRTDAFPFLKGKVIKVIIN